MHPPTPTGSSQKNRSARSTSKSRYGGRAIVLARFVPIVRTFAPVATGVGQMRYRQFVAYNAIGALQWGTGVTLLGAWLGHLAVVRASIDLILIAIVAVSVVPIAFEVLRARLRGRRGENPQAVTAATFGPEQQGSRDALV